jgi:hypothetical protein
MGFVSSHLGSRGQETDLEQAKAGNGRRPTRDAKPDAGSLLGGEREQLGTAEVEHPGAAAATATATYPSVADDRMGESLKCHGLVMVIYSLHAKSHSCPRAPLPPHPPIEAVSAGVHLLWPEERVRCFFARHSTPTPRHPAVYRHSLPVTATSKLLSQDKKSWTRSLNQRLHTACSLRRPRGAPRAAPCPAQQYV